VFARNRQAVTPAIVGLAVAIGFCVSLSALTTSILFRSPGVRDPETLVWVSRVADPGTSTGSAWTYDEFSHLAQVAERIPIAALAEGVRDLDTIDGVSRTAVPAAFVTRDFFGVTGADARLGRLFDARDFSEARHVVVLSDDLWSRLFDRDESVLGARLDVNGRPMQIIGVTVRSATGPSSKGGPGVWLPIHEVSAAQADLGNTYVRTLARMSRSGDEASLRASAAALFAGGRTSPFRLELRSVARLPADSRAERVAPMLAALVASVMLVALANFTGIILCVTSERRHEFAIRRTLGASRSVVIRGLLLQSAVVAAVASLAALVSAAWWLPTLADWVHVPLGTDIRMGSAEYALVVSAAGAAAAISAAVAFRHAYGTAFHEDLRCTNASVIDALRGRRLFVAGQVFVSSALTVAAISLVHSAVRAERAPVGFDADRLLFLNGPVVGGEWTDAQAERYWAAASMRLRSLHGLVDGVALSQFTFGGSSHTDVATLRSERQRVAVNRVSGQYFDVSGTPLIAGRTFSDDEIDAGAPVAVISRKIASDVLGAQAPLGESLGRLDRKYAGLIVIGVAENAVATDLLELSQPIGGIYLPLTREFAADACLLIRANVPPDRRAKDAIDEALPRYRSDRRPVTRRLAAAVDGQRRLAVVPSRIAAGAGGAVLLLASLGLHALIALIVRQRTREIAVRMSLGAGKGGIALFAGRLAFGPSLFGVAAGLVAGMGLVRALSVLTFGVEPGGAWPLIGSLLALSLAIGTGAIGPLRRALRVDPAVLLKDW
jgi:predicted permease